jgi:hypothetical protein
LSRAAVAIRAAPYGLSASCAVSEAADRTWEEVAGPPQGFVPWPALNAGEAPLDPPIRPLVAALNRTGWIRTVFSCGGHPEEPEAAARGRRQAHVDALVADPARWRAFLRRVRAAAPAAVRDLGPPPGAPPGGLRVAEGTLGAPPRWLRAALLGEDAGALDRTAPSWWTQLLPDALTAAPDAQGRRWRYRRLVLEPVPYDLPAAVCRRVLDAALAAAQAALLQEDGARDSGGGALSAAKEE